MPSANVGGSGAGPRRMRRFRTYRSRQAQHQRHRNLHLPMARAYRNRERYDPATMDISGNTATDAGDYTVRVTSKTGKWADGSTEAVTAAWSIGKATQEAPNGLIGVAPTTVGGSDGKITGVDATMEYRAESETIYTACTGIEIENLSAGNYFVRYAEDNNHFAGTDAEVTVGKGAPLADCTITFDGNGGSGSMGPVTIKAGTNYILPACGFTAPADQEFKAWEIGGTEYKVGDSYTVNGDIEIKHCGGTALLPTTYTVTVSNDGNGTGTATPSHRCGRHRNHPDRSALPATTSRSGRSSAAA